MPRGPEHYYQRESLSVRVVLGVVLLIATLGAGYVAWQTPEEVFGVPLETGEPSISGAVNQATGEPLKASCHPDIIGPGYLFHVTLEIPAGLDGAAKLLSAQVETDNPYWPTMTLDQVLLDDWEPPGPKAEMGTLEYTYVNLQVPKRNELIDQTVELRFKIRGERPVWQGDTVTTERFSETLIVPCRLGSGHILVTSPWQLSKYNRRLWVVLFFIGAYLTAQLPIRLRRPKRRELPGHVGARKR